MLRGLRGVASCGMNSVARTIGPATRCGKKDRYTAVSMGLASGVLPRYTSTT